MKWPVINKISFVLQYFVISCILIVHCMRFSTYGIIALSWARWVAFREFLFFIFYFILFYFKFILILRYIHLWNSKRDDFFLKLCIFVRGVHICNLFLVIMCKKFEKLIWNSSPNFAFFFIWKEFFFSLVPKKVLWYQMWRISCNK